MARDLGFNDHVLGMGIGIFFVSYVTLQIPGASPDASRYASNGGRG